MNTRVLAVSTVAIALIGIGVVSAFGFGGFGRFLGVDANSAYSANVVYNGNFVGHAPYNGVYSWNGAAQGTWNYSAYNGIYNVYNDIRGAISYNSVAVIKEKAAVAQCDTTHANNVSAAVSNDFGINVSTSQVDQANGNLQSNVSANATSWYSKMSFALFRSALRSFLLHFEVATHTLNATQMATLKASENSSAAVVSNCISTTGASGLLAHGWGGLGAGTGFRGLSACTCEDKSS